MKIQRSVINTIPDFALRVAEHGKHVRDWLSHMERVAADAANTLLAPEARHAPFPPPEEIAAISACVDARGYPDYEIEEDGPSAADILAEKKSLLIGKIIAAEAAAIETIIPFSRRRLLLLREAEIRRGDADLALAAVSAKSTALAKLKRVIGIDDPIDIDAEVRAARSDEDNVFLDEAAARQARIDVIQRTAAEAMHAVEDLIGETVDNFAIPDFSKI